MTNTWNQCVKDALFAAQQFFLEKKPGQYPVGVVMVQQFAAVILQSDVDVQIGPQLRSILSNAELVSIMCKGLMLKVANKAIVGEFFKQTNPSIYYVQECAIITLGIRDMLKSVSNHSTRTQAVEKGNVVNLYIMSCLSEAFTTYITQIGPSFMDKGTRDKIVGNTAITHMSPPYQRGLRGTAMRAVIEDGLNDPIAAPFLDSHIGSNVRRGLIAVTKSFNTTQIEDLQDGMTSSLATQKAGPMFAAARKIYITAVGAVQAKDGVKSYDQE